MKYAHEMQKIAEDYNQVKANERKQIARDYIEKEIMPDIEATAGKGLFSTRKILFDISREVREQIEYILIGYGYKVRYVSETTMIIEWVK